MMCWTFVSSATIEPPDEDEIICSEECDSFHDCPCSCTCAHRCGWCDEFNHFVEAGDTCE